MSARRCVVTAGPLTRPRRCTRRGGPPRPPASGRGDGIPYPPASGRRGGPLRPPATIHRVNRSTDHAPAIHAHATPTKPPTGASQLSAQTVGHAVPATPCLNRSTAHTRFPSTPTPLQNKAPPGAAQLSAQGVNPGRTTHPSSLSPARAAQPLTWRRIRYDPHAQPDLPAPTRTVGVDRCVHPTAARRHAARCWSHPLPTSRAAAP